MATPFVHGPVHVFVGLGTSGTPNYLGTGQRAPRYRIRREYEGVWNDLGGVKIPYDYSIQGAEAFVTVRLTRWNQSVLAAIEDVPGASSGITLPGTMLADDIGSLLMTEQLAVPLWVMYGFGASGPAGGVAAFTGAGMPPGYRFPLSFLDQDEEREGGTDPAGVTLTWHCMRQFVPSTGAWLLFDNTMSGLPALN